MSFLKLAYQLRRHRLWNWRLDRWIVTVAWAAGAVLLLAWLLRGRPPLTAWEWLILALLAAAGVAVLAGRLWAESRTYTAFRPQPQAPRPAPSALAPEDKVPLEAAGRFSVMGKTQTFAGLAAYWRTFATREHAVMAINHASAFLLVGRTPPEETGLWYIFIRPESIEQITPGQIAASGSARPGLRIRYRETGEADQTNDGRRRTKAAARRTAYLAFDDPTARDCVWADLLADRTGG